MERSCLSTPSGNGFPTLGLSTHVSDFEFWWLCLHRLRNGSTFPRSVPFSREGWISLRNAWASGDTLFFLNLFTYLLFIYFWLLSVSIAACIFSLLVESEGYSLVAVRAPYHRDGFSCWGTQALECAGFISGDTQAQLPCGTWNLPGQGIEPVFPALAGRFLTIGPPGISPRWYSNFIFLIYRYSGLVCWVLSGELVISYLTCTWNNCSPFTSGHSERPSPACQIWHGTFSFRDPMVS